MASGYDAAVTGHRHHHGGFAGHDLLVGPWDTDLGGHHHSADDLLDMASPGEQSALSLWGDEPVLMAAHQSQLDLDVHGLLDAHPYATALLAPQSPGPGQAAATWKCLTCPASVQGAGCTRCTAPPSPGHVDEYQLVGDPGQKNGEKLLRSGLVVSPEWQNNEMRADTARVAAAEGLHGLAEALLRKDSAKLRKAQYMWLCRHWGYASWIWQRKSPAGGGHGQQQQQQLQGVASQTQLSPVGGSSSPLEQTTVSTVHLARAKRTGKRACRPQGPSTSPPVATPHRDLGVPNQEVHPQLHHMIQGLTAAHVPVVAVRILHMAAQSAPGMPMTLPRMEVLRSYGPMLVRLRDACAQDAAAFGLQRGALGHEELETSQLWMPWCATSQRCVTTLDILDKTVVQPVVVAQASGYDLMEFNTMDRAYVATCGYTVEHVARFLAMAQGTVAQARTQTRGQYLATAQCVAQAMTKLVESLMQMLELRLQFLAVQTRKVSYDHGCRELVTAAPPPPRPASPGPSPPGTPVLSQGLSTSLVCIATLKENIAAGCQTTCDESVNTLMHSWKNKLEGAVACIEAGVEVNQLD